MIIGAKRMIKITGIIQIPIMMVGERQTIKIAGVIQIIIMITGITKKIAIAGLHPIITIIIEIHLISKIIINLTKRMISGKTTIITITSIKIIINPGIKLKKIKIIQKQILQAGANHQIIKITTNIINIVIIIGIIKMMNGEIQIIKM